MDATEPSVLAGVHPGQSPAVVREAARMAGALGLPLVCAYSDPARFPLAQSPDGSVTSAPVDPDFMDDAGASFPVHLAAELALLLDGALPRDADGVPGWRTVLLAGDPADALARCAETVNAAMIVVGTHGASQAPLREILGRSVAARLARRQQRPVHVVPTHHERTAGAGPAAGGRDLP